MVHSKHKRRVSVDGRSAQSLAVRLSAVIYSKIFVSKEVAMSLEQENDTRET